MDYRAAAAGPTLLHPLVHRLPSIYKITANNCLLSVHNRYLVKPIVVLFVTVACKYCQIYETYFSYLYNRTDKITVFHCDHFLLLDGVFHYGHFLSLDGVFHYDHFLLLDGVFTIYRYAD